MSGKESSDVIAGYYSGRAFGAEAAHQATIEAEALGPTSDRSARVGHAPAE